MGILQMDYGGECLFSIKMYQRAIYIVHLRENFLNVVIYDYPNRIGFHSWLFSNCP